MYCEISLIYRDIRAAVPPFRFAGTLGLSIVLESTRGEPMTENEALELSIIERRRLVLLSTHPSQHKEIELSRVDREGVETLHDFRATLLRVAGTKLGWKGNE